MSQDMGSPAGTEEARWIICQLAFPIWLESQLSRMNCQIFSTGFSSGARDGSGMRVMLFGIGPVAEKFRSPI